ncbi:MAG: glycosyltransferase family 8 protein [Acutalibacteraceae bacterium]
MNIMISVNQNYILPAKVMLKSLAMNSGGDLNIYLLYSSLKEKDIHAFSKFCSSECGAKLYPIYINPDIFVDMPLTGWFSVEIYFRLVAPFILPDSVQRILWIDADVIVKKDISELYYLPMKNAAIGVIRDMGGEYLVSECCERLQLNSLYFNSGVILFNLDTIRAHWTKESFLEQIRDISGEKLIYPDQDMLNLIFEKDKLILPDIWNYQIRSWSDITLDVIENVAIIHFVGQIKPWDINYGNKARQIWWKYYSACGWKNGYYLARLKNVYNRYIGNRIIRLKGRNQEK